jgi:hypothetical protein
MTVVGRFQSLNRLKFDLAECLQLARIGRSQGLLGKSALPPITDIESAMSAFPASATAFRPKADVEVAGAECPLVTLMRH